MTKAVQSVAQPIVCCVGASVAGQATQFLFERAVVDQGSDWRAISVEVSPSRFAAASDGMLAMQFQGMRLLGEFQSDAVMHLAAEEPAAKFIGKLTSGLRQNDHWMLWDHVGYAWLDIARRLSGDVTPILWLHGDSRTTRSTLVALSMHAEKNFNWLWTNAPEFDSEAHWLHSLGDWKAEGRIQQQLHSATCIEMLTRWLPEAVRVESNKPIDTSAEDCLPTERKAEDSTSQQSPSVEQTAEDRQSTLAFISEERFPDELPGMLAQLPLILIAMKAPKLPEAMEKRPVRAVSPAELVVAGEAFDFRRWTGRPVDLLLLQDAYDEYCDF